MKNIKLYNILLLMAVVIFTSCEDQLEIRSEDDVSPEVALGSTTTIEGLVLGLYSQAQDVDAFNGGAQTATEFQADNSVFKGSFPTLRAIYDYTQQADNTSISGYWLENFDVIEASNFVINNLPPVDLDDLSEDTKNQYIGEARFVRALTMFNLSEYFGQPYQVADGASLSIPIILEDFRGDNIEDFQGPRNTLNEVYDQIATDLDFAINNLPESYDANADTRGRATSGAAKALLARLELYRENNEAAAQLATEVINSSVYNLAAGFDFYNALTSEDVFTIINTSIDNQATIGYSDLLNPTPEARGDAPFSPNLIAAYQEEEGDLRFSELTQVGTDAQGDTTAVFTTKFDDGETLSDNAPIIRITEVYLIRAEANLKAGTSTGDTPLNDINRLRTRAGLDALATVSIEDIVRERRKELAFEGSHRRMDLLRNRMNLRRAGQPNVDDSALGASKTIFPIPTREIDLNPSLEQNPGY